MPSPDAGPAETDSFSSQWRRVINQYQDDADRHRVYDILKGFGRSWIPKEIGVIYAGLENAAHVRSVVEIPDTLPQDELQMLLSATGGIVSLHGNMTIGDRSKALIRADVSAESILLHIEGSRNVQLTKNLEGKFRELEEQEDEFRTRWTDRINGATGGNVDDRHALLDGLFVVRRLSSMQYSSKNEAKQLRAWLDSRYSPEDQQFLHMLNLSGLYFAQVEQVIDYKLKEIKDLSPDVIKKVIAEIVDVVLGDEKVGLGDIRFWEDELTYTMTTLQQTLNVGRHAEVLTNKTGLLARGAAENDDPIGVISQIIAASHDEAVSFDQEKGTLLFRGGNLRGSLEKLQQFFQTISKQIALSTNIAFSDTISVPEDKISPLIEYSTLLSNVHEAKYPKKTIELIEQQTDQGHVFFSAVGVTNSGKTTLSANAAELLMQKFPDYNLKILTLPKNTRDPDALALAIESVLNRMIFKKENILLVVEDAHLIFKDATNAQLNRLQSILNMFHAIVEKLPSVGGMILNSEQSLPRKAIGMWQRLPEVQLTLFQEHALKYNTEILTDILNLHSSVFEGISNESRKKVIEFTAKLISAKEIDDISFISPGLLLGELSTAARRIDKGEEPKEVLAEIKRNINEHIINVKTEQTGDAVTQLEKRIEERLDSHNKAVGELRVELAALRNDMVRAQEALAAVKDFKDLVARMVAVEEKIAAMVQQPETSAVKKLEIRSGKTFFGAATPSKPTSSKAPSRFR